MSRFDDNEKKIKLHSPTKENFASRINSETDSLKHFKNTAPMYLAGLHSQEVLSETSSAYSKFRDF